jgi:Fluoroacetyl-CoA-specific thioesterase
MKMEPLENIRVGMTGRHEVVVARELTVGAVLDGMPFVFGTPMMILAMELASAAAAAPHLPEGWVTVGSEVNVRHISPRLRSGARLSPPHGSSKSLPALCCSQSKRMMVCARSARGRTAAPRSTWRASPSASPPSRSAAAAALLASASSLLARAAIC